MTSPSIGRMRATTDDRIGWVTFDNPERRNAVSIDMWNSIPDIVARFVADDNVRVIVFRGEGEKAFVSGADISQFETQRTSAEAVARYEEIADRAARAITECEKPTIALIHGFCIGGGVGVALSCDLRIAATDAVFLIPAGRIGLGYRVSSVKKLIDTVGAAKAKEIFFTGDRFDAEHAAEFGLVNQVVPKQELDAHVTALATRIAAQAPLTLKAFKKTANLLLKSAPGAVTAECDALIRACFESADYAEGRRAFAEKRPPVFSGR
jgi:enoyl-CoA hydratase